MTKIPEKNYEPKSFESRIYEEWERGGHFHTEPDASKEPFTIVMPPPNITGQLHMGHALDETLQDVLTRFKRLQGYVTLWLPGTDHASIATEVKVADEIRETEGKTKEELGREEFLKRAWAWKELYGGRITEQQRRLGTSCDWERERFTMDEGLNKAVIESFVRLYEKGYIYKGNRMINWCPVCGTSLSDAEVEHDDVSGLYWYFRYPGADGSEGIVVATSRPETMFGDTAIAVNPDDDRYKDMIGKNVILPVVGREIPVVADPYPDPEKGTGAVKITPAHDPNDFEVGERHGLARIVCIDFDAKMTSEAGKYEGMDRYECRKVWAKELEEGGYLVKTENVVIPTGKCYRCNTVVEPMISDQWFVRMDDLAKPAIKAAENGELVHVPERFEKTYLHWLEGIRDWCISRQLWWGHRIPAYYCDKCGEIIVSRERPDACPKCGASGDVLPDGTSLIRQDEDVLDTWFSSALWPFSTLGWPEKTPDLDYFYPTSVLVTGYDIIFFWVVRMVFSGYEAMGESPFKQVFVHGLVLDSDGRKMSKSLGNGVDPLEVIDRYGADALRFMLISGSATGNDMRFSDDKIESARNFANKLWNASRFIIMNLGDGGAEAVPDIADIDPARLKNEDLWIQEKIARASRSITRNLESFDLSVATQKILELIWNEYCDWYIEFVKPRLMSDDEQDKEACRAVLIAALSDLLRLLHPFMPFITEEIWSFLGKDGKLISDRWVASGADTGSAGGSGVTGGATGAGGVSSADGSAIAGSVGVAGDSDVTRGTISSRGNAHDAIETVKDIVREVRRMRKESGAAPSRSFPIVIGTATADGTAMTNAAIGAEISASTGGTNTAPIIDGTEVAETSGFTSGTAPSSITSVTEKIGDMQMLICKLANVSDVTVAQSSADIPQDAMSAILPEFTIYIAADDLLDYAAERERLTKEKERMEGNIARLRGKLSNEGFIAKAPENVVRVEREKLAAEEDAFEKVVVRLRSIEGK